MTTCSTLINNKYQKLREQFQDDLDGMLEDIKSIRENHSTPDGFRKKLNEYIKETGEEKFLNEREKFRQIAKRESNLKRIKDPSFKGNLTEGLASLLRQTNYSIKESGNSIESVMSSLNKKFITYLDQAFSEDDMKIIISRDLDKEIITHLASEGRTKVSPLAERYAKTFKKLQDILYTEKRNAGIDVGYLKDYSVNQKDIHNIEKMRALGQDAWVSKMVENLDMERTFPFITGPDERIKYLKDVYDSFLSREIDKESVDFNNIPKDLVKSSIQRKNLQPRKLHFSPEGMANMWLEFSDKNILESMVADSARAARDVAIYDILGPNGQNEFSTLKQKVSREIAEQKAKATDPKEKAKLEAELNKINGRFTGGLESFDNLWAVINGTVDQVENKTYATAGENIRALTSMNILGGSMFSAFTDIWNGVSALNIATGGGYFKAMSDMTQGLVLSLPPGQQKKAAAMLNIALESGMGNLLRINGSSDAFSKGVNKVNYLYSKINPIAQQGRFHRVAATTMYGIELDDVSRGQWSSLNDWHKAGLEKAGITESDWEAFGAMRSEIKEGVFVISPGSISGITDEMAKKAIQENKAKNKLFFPSKPDEYRAYLSKRVAVLYDEFANFAAPNPGLRERAILTQGTKKGGLGEFVRMVGMLKSFTVKQASIMEKIYRSNPNGAGNIKHLSGQVAGLVAFGYVALSLRSIANNETPPDPTSPETMKKSILASGAFGLLGDTLLSESERGAGPLTSFATGPVISKADEFIKGVKKAASGAAKGEPKLKDFGELASFLPGSNLFYLKAALNYTIMDDIKEEMRPGHKKRMRDRYRENEGMLWKQEKIIQ